MTNARQRQTHEYEVIERRPDRRYVGMLANDILIRPCCPFRLSNLCPLCIPTVNIIVIQRHSPKEPVDPALSRVWLVVGHGRR